VRPAASAQLAGRHGTSLRQHTREAEVGSYLTVATDGLDALRAIDADSPVMAVGFPTSHAVLFSRTGKRLADAPIGSTRDGGMVSHIIKRAQSACGPHRCPIDLTGAPIHQVTPF
jgi:hypothetical protein